MSRQDNGKVAVGGLDDTLTKATTIGRWEASSPRVRTTPLVTELDGETNETDALLEKLDCVCLELESERDDAKGPTRGIDDTRVQVEFGEETLVKAGDKGRSTVTVNDNMPPGRTRRALARRSGRPDKVEPDRLAKLARPFPLALRAWCASVCEITLGVMFFPVVVAMGRSPPKAVKVGAAISLFALATLSYVIPTCVITISGMWWAPWVACITFTALLFVLYVNYAM